MVKEGWRGRYYEDFEVGDVYRHRLGRTVTESDNTLFTMLTLNSNPIHFDANLAEKTPFGRILVNSCYTLSLAVGLSVADLSEHVMANLGWNDIKLPSPVFVGDTMYASSEILAKRESESRPDVGIVTARTTGVNQRGRTIISYERTIMVYRRGKDPRDALFAAPPGA
jgi:acyl dehydratase